jgi:hypothetical protein
MQKTNWNYSFRSICNFGKSLPDYQILDPPWTLVEVMWRCGPPAGSNAHFLVPGSGNLQDDWAKFEIAIHLHEIRIPEIMVTCMDI